LGKLDSSAFDTLKNATNGEADVFGVHVDLNPFW
jgi:hypothetical protein